MKLAVDSAKEMTDSGGAMSSMGAQGHGASSGGYSLTHKRSEALLVEWTDSVSVFDNFNNLLS